MYLSELDEKQLPRSIILESWNIKNEMKEKDAKLTITMTWNMAGIFRIITKQCLSY